MEVECPVCARKFNNNFINFHLDNCLENVAESSQNAIKRRSGETSNIPEMKKSKNSVVNDDNSKLNIETEKTPQKLPSIFEKKLKNHHNNNNSQDNDSKTSLKTLKQFAPLADQMRPYSLKEYSGQEHILGKECILRKLIENNEIPSMIFWGPPGCGKTTLAHIIAKRNQELEKNRFITLSAAASGVKEVKEAIETAKSTQRIFKKKTILFIDEIHRFNKLQQDTFLPFVENGTIILLGATTENPSFSLNSSLLSRCRVIILEKLAMHRIQEILERALNKINFKIIENVNSLTGTIKGKYIEKSAIKNLSELCDGDARFALNCLEMSIQSLNSAEELCETENNICIIKTEHITKGLKRLHLLYDRTGDQHYNCISAFIKSMRGSSVDAALYWLARMIESGEDPRFIARRMVIFASEDIGIADSNALNLAVSTLSCCQNIGMPECRINLAHCATYLAKATKSRDCYEAFERALEYVKNQKGAHPAVPLHLCNAPTRLMKEMGCGKGYEMYNDNLSSYLPESLQNVKFYRGNV